MRLFVAVDLSPETRAQVSDVQGQLGVALASRRPPRISWVKPDGAHVTMRFLGEVPEQYVERIANLLGSRQLADRRFEIVWETVGAFPDLRKPRVLWIGATSGTESLGALAGVVRERLATVGSATEDRPFRPHVTIARVRDPGIGVSWPTALSKVHLTPTISPVDHVTLYQSQLSPKGPRYTAMATFHF